MTALHLTRAERILLFLADAKGAQLPAIAIAVEGKKDARAHTNQVAAELRKLLAAKAIKRTGKPRSYAYSLLKAKTAAPPPATTGYLSPKARKPTPEQQPQIIERKPEPNIAPAWGRALRGVTSDDIAADVASYLAKGGRIQQLAPHEGKPFERLFRDDPKPPKPPRRKALRDADELDAVA